MFNIKREIERDHNDYFPFFAPHKPFGSHFSKAKLQYKDKELASLNFNSYRKKKKKKMDDIIFILLCLPTFQFCF